MIIQCKNCEFCKQYGRMQTIGHKQGRKKYFCEHPQTKNMKVRLLPLNNFIGFGSMTDESPLSLKSAKRWCPKKSVLEEVADQ